MKIAFHFSSTHSDVSGSYGYKIAKYFYPLLLDKRVLHLRTKVFIGDVPIYKLCLNKEGKFDQASVEAGVERWLNTGNHILIAFKKGVNIPLFLMQEEPYVILLDSIDYETTQYLCEALEQLPFFVGAVEVDETYPVHWALYRLIPRHRIIDKRAYIFWDGYSEDSKDAWEIEIFLKYGFEKVSFESLNGRYTIFDAQESFDHYRRHAELRQKAGDFLSFLVETTANRLEDLIPDIVDMLWSAMNSLQLAETSEQYSQVASSCRRIIEQVIDALEPPTPKDEVFGLGKFKNRIKKYADSRKASDSTLEFVAKSGDEFKKQVDLLTQATSKGVHSDILFSEARRCFIRMIVLLDDVLALNPSQFPMKIILDQSFLDEITGNIKPNED